MIFVGLDDNYIPFTRDKIFFSIFCRCVEARVLAALNSSTSSEVSVTLKVLRFIVIYSILLYGHVTFVKFL